MARPGLLKHRKFRALSRAVGNPALALGSLELLWHACWDACDPIVGTAEDVEDVTFWRGERGALVGALLDAGFIDYDTSANVYSVHDFADHAPDYVKKRIARESAKHAANGGRPADKRTPHIQTNGGHGDEQTAETRTPPNPVQPIPVQPDQVPSAEDSRFDRFWSAYPKHVGRKAAEKAFRALKPSEALLDIMLAALSQQCLWPSWRKDRGEFIPHPVTWLHQQRWEDEPPTKVVVSITRSKGDWECPHEPRCLAQSTCDRLLAIAEAKAGGAA
jgi:hypothetical protein